jgi:hypothetical protein
MDRWMPVGKTRDIFLDRRVLTPETLRTFALSAQLVEMTDVTAAKAYPGMRRLPFAASFRGRTSRQMMQVMS